MANMNFSLNMKGFAYPASNLCENESVSPCLCSLVYGWTNLTATLLFVLNIPTARSTGDSESVLQYNADK
jgi:hypothetical protein